MAIGHHTGGGLANKLSALVAASLVALVGGLAETTAQAQTAESPLQFERGYPSAITAEKAHDAADLRRAIEAYKFFFPTMGSQAVMQQMLFNDAEINEAGHVMATTPLQ
jgi:hypothetical protein